MNNVFLFIRTVVFALLTYLHALTLVFASWNIVVAKSSGMSAPGASVFLIMSSVFTFVLVLMAYLAELICAGARPAHVRVECAWTTFMSIFQLAATIDVTMNGPAVYCQVHPRWAMCASSSLLVHVSWLITLVLLSYCLTICLATAVHATSLPDIWTTPVTHVPWFCLDIEALAPVATSHVSPRKHAETWSWSSSSSGCVVSRYITERWGRLSRMESQSASTGPILFANGRQSVDTTRPAWARLQVTRRGIDNPFAKPLPRCGQVPVVLAPPPRIRSRQVALSWGSHPTEVNERAETKSILSSYSTSTAQTSTMFPWVTTNPDLPIPRPHLSEWVRANGVGNTVHTEPIA